MNDLPKSLAIDAALRCFLDPQADPADCFTRLFDAIRPRRGASGTADYELALRTIEANPAYRAAVRARFLAFFTHRKQIDFFADSGVLPNAGFFSELARRLTEPLLPPLRDAGSLQDAIGLVFHAAHDPAWLAALPPELPRRFWSIVHPTAGDDDRQLTRRVVDQMLEALLVVSHRVSALGLEPELVRNQPELMEFESPFIAQGVESTRFVNAYRRSLDDPAAPCEDERHLLVLVEQCRDVLTRVRRTALTRGTSLGLTYILVRLWQSLGRIEALAAVLAARFRADAGEAALAHWVDLMRTAIRGETGRRGIRRHFQQLFGMMALRVTDNAAHRRALHRGQPARATSRMWRSAMGAGLHHRRHGAAQDPARRLGARRR